MEVVPLKPSPRGPREVELHLGYLFLDIGLVFLPGMHFAEEDAVAMVHRHEVILVADIFVGNSLIYTEKLKTMGYESIYLFVKSGALGLRLLSMTAYT